jgi:hypothetical protein
MVCGLRRTPSELRGNGLQQLITLGESKLVCRRFKNRLKSLGIYRPCYIDKAILVRGKIEHRFDVTMSNRKFKYNFVRNGGDIRQLKSLPRTPYRPVVAYRDESRAGRLTKACRRLPGGVVWRSNPREKAKRRVPRVNPEGNGSGQSPANPAGRALARKARTILSNPSIRPVSVFGRGVCHVIGGTVVPAPPAPGHTKYWYFLRRRGFWTPSRHHPHKDDSEVYNFIEVHEDSVD